MKIPIYEIFILNTDQVGIALVDDPAIEEDFIFFKSDDPVKMVFNDEKMIIKGPALIPNRLIYKNDKYGERYVFYSEDTILKFVEYLMNKKDNKFNLLHTDAYINVNVIESYFATENNEFGVPKNSWIISAKVKDPEVWSKIKTGELKGFSVEGLFSNEIVDFTEARFNDEKIKSNMNELKDKLISAINEVFFNRETEEVKEDVKQDVKEEEFASDKVDDVKDAVKEEVEDVKEEEVVKEEVVVEEEPAFDMDEFKAMLEEFKKSLNSDIDSKIESIKNEIKDLDSKVEKFSKEPITDSIVEPVANISTIKKTKAAKYF